jgi:hypothetical protein
MWRVLCDSPARREVMVKTLDERLFFLDAHLALNMLEGMSYEKAVEQAGIALREYLSESVERREVEDDW